MSPFPQTISQIKQAVERQRSHPNIIAEMLIRRPGFTSLNTLLHWQDVHTDWRGQLYWGFCSLGLISAGQFMPRLRREKDLLANNNLVSPNTLVSRAIFFLKSHFSLIFVSFYLPWCLKEINSSLNSKRKTHTHYNSLIQLAQVVRVSSVQKRLWILFPIRGHHGWKFKPRIELGWDEHGR